MGRVDLHSVLQQPGYTLLINRYTLSRLRIPRLEYADFAEWLGLGAKAQDESAIARLCNKVNCAARENALGCNAIRQKICATNGSS